MPCIQVKKKKKKRQKEAKAKAKASRWEKQLGFQATYYSWLPLDNPFLLTNWSSWLVHKTLNKTTPTQLCKTHALLNCFLILKRQLGKLEGLAYRFNLHIFWIPSIWKKLLVPTTKTNCSALPKKLKHGSILIPSLNVLLKTADLWFITSVSYLGGWILNLSKDFWIKEGTCWYFDGTCSC